MNPNEIRRNIQLACIDRLELKQLRQEQKRNFTPPRYDDVYFNGLRELFPDDYPASQPETVHPSLKGNP